MNSFPCFCLGGNVTVVDTLDFAGKHLINRLIVPGQKEISVKKSGHKRYRHCYHPASRYFYRINIVCDMDKVYVHLGVSPQPDKRRVFHVW